MAGPLLWDILLHSSQFQNFRRFVAGISVNVTPHRLFCSAPTIRISGQTGKEASHAGQISKLQDDPDNEEWKDKAKEIVKDIDPIVRLAKDILHSGRYMVGEQLTDEDEKVVVEKLLVYHPHYDDKIGCSLASVMVGHHPVFNYSKCLFVVRTNGDSIDFSYTKCLHEYIRNKYPSHAKRFIQEHLKHGSVGGRATDK
ncbi:protein DCL, chloroplastic-like [Prosopis cineraria]|uniref:protein DCL, chloroplastic-like n=1 Tax=Prosopis cineraria TaxID=364024 RepID=UPI00240FB3C1|nr:protein DCL, chloroplastic-like [Prosopis cineraria]XP_054789704.1 protein DCL, chloroplastic-like [Prosopis cineraria]